MNQGKLEMVKQEMARVSINILGSSELKWAGMGDFNSDNHYIYYFEQDYLRAIRVTLIVNKRVQNAVHGCNLKNNRMISAHFQGKPFSTTVMQVYTPTSNTEEAEAEWFYEDFLELKQTNKKRCPFHYRGLEWKSQEIPAVTGKFGFVVQNKACNRLTV